MADVVNLAPPSAADKQDGKPAAVAPAIAAAAAAQEPQWMRASPNQAAFASTAANHHLSLVRDKFKKNVPHAASLMRTAKRSANPKSPFSIFDSKHPWWIRAGVNGTFLVLTGVVVGETLVTVELYQRHNRLGGVETRLISNGITTSNIFLWPILWDLTIGYERMVEQPRIAFGFFWPMVISSLDMRYIMDQRVGSSHNMDKLAAGLNMDAQAIISAAFAMGALMSSLKSVRGTHIIMYALIMSLALVIPQISTPSHTPDRTIILSAQKAALNNAIGFIIAGIGADFLSGGASKQVFRNM